MFCAAGPHDRDEVNYDPRPREPTRPIYPQYPSNQQNNRPHQYKVAIGDEATLSCQIGNHDKRTSWRRVDGQPLPRNSHMSGGDLVIDYAQEDAGGVYECVVHEPHGDYPILTADLVVIGEK